MINESITQLCVGEISSWKILIGAVPPVDDVYEMINIIIVYH